MEQLSFEEGLVIARHVENVPEANDRCFRLPTRVLNSAKSMTSLVDPLHAALRPMHLIHKCGK
jgi:hypothetical protein